MKKRAMTTNEKKMFLFCSQSPNFLFVFKTYVKKDEKTVVRRKKTYKDIKLVKRQHNDYHNSLNGYRIFYFLMK